MTAPADSQKAFEAIHRALAQEPRTSEPLNALVLWTELGKGLSGTLERVGAEKGLLRSLIHKYAHEKGVEPEVVELNQWMYRLEPEARLGKVEAGMAMKRVHAAIEDALPELAAQAETDDQGRKGLFLVVVSAWYQVGLDIVRALPKGKDATDAQRAGVLAAWCDRYLPQSDADAASLGVRVTREDS